MTDQPSNASSVKLGLAVAWPAFWTGIPAKIAFVLLLLAAGLPPWEGVGLVFLLLLSIPIDIWAMGVSSRTVFLERLRLQPPDGIGLTLWWQSALLNVVYLPLAYFIQGYAKEGSKAVAGKIMEIGLIKGLPVAERISIELTLWGTAATIALVALILGWLSLFGWIVRRQTAGAKAAEASYQGLVRQWDLMRVPADQPLMLTVFTAVGVLLVVALWSFMPVTTPHPHEQYKKDAVKVEPPFKPVEALQKTEKLMAQAEVALQALEEQKAQEEAKAKGKGKNTGKENGASKGAAGAQVQPAGGAAKAGQAPAASGQTDQRAAQGAGGQKR
ncbi:MAG: hypothetical protein FJ246_02650 [Nitrospira sp.]|nr:hypothetical protein [Nitrospira sp.]